MIWFLVVFFCVWFFFEVFRRTLDRRGFFFCYYIVLVGLILCLLALLTFVIESLGTGTIWVKLWIFFVLLMDV